MARTKGLIGTHLGPSGGFHPSNPSLMWARTARRGRAVKAQGWQSSLAGAAPPSLESRLVEISPDLKNLLREGGRQIASLSAVTVVENRSRPPFPLLAGQNRHNNKKRGTLAGNVTAGSSRTIPLSEHLTLGRGPDPPPPPPPQPPPSRSSLSLLRPPLSLMSASCFSGSALAPKACTQHCHLCLPERWRSRRRRQVNR